MSVQYIPPYIPLYIVKLGYTGVYLFFFSALKHRLWVLVTTALARRCLRVHTIHGQSASALLNKTEHTFY